jgi:predicted transposase/invertase (TIGR01784 family)
MSNNIKLIRFDWAMKNILRDKANFDILEGFLTALLKKDIKILNIIESESNQDAQFDKFNKVDLLVVDNYNEHIIIEIQNQRQVHYLERILYGTSKLIIDNISLGDPYDKVKKIISVSILYFTYGIDIDDYVYYGTTDIMGVNNNKPLKIRKREKNEHKKNSYKMVESKDIFPEYYLIEVEKFQDIIKNDLDEWIYFFKNEKILDNFKSKNIHKIEQKCNLLKMTPAEKKQYERYIDSVVTVRDVITEEKMEEKIEIAKNLKNLNVDINKIAKATGLSIEKIEKL